MIKIKHKDFLSISILFFICFFVLLPERNYQGDYNTFRVWAEEIYLNGLKNAYNSGANYPPIFLYCLKLYSIVQDDINSLRLNLNYLKIFNLIAHFYTCYFILKIIYKQNLNYKNSYKVLFYFINISVLYNSLLWGQIDEIFTCFLVGSLYYLINKDLTKCYTFLVFAFNTKLQSIVFFPIFFIVSIPLLISFSKNELFKLVFTLVVVQFLLLLPFIINGQFYKVLNIWNQSHDMFKAISMNAYNFWMFFFPDKHMSMNDNLLFYGISLQNIGLILFCIFSVFALYPLFILSYKNWKLSIHNLDINIILLTLSLVGLLFFYFNTRMHERYTHPVIVFVILFNILNDKYLLGILVSIAFFLNLDAVFHSFMFQNYKVLIFNKIFISILFLITIIMLFYELYFNEKKSTDL